jgi:hypothetical protein
MQLEQLKNYNAIAAYCGANPVTRTAALVGTKKEVSEFIKAAIAAYSKVDTLEAYREMKLKYRLALTPARLTDVKKSVAVENLRKDLLKVINVKHKILENQEG